MPARPLLVVNTASLCGYTPQYAGLAGIVDGISRPRPDDHRRPLQRFRRTGTRRRDRNRAAPRSTIGVTFPIAAKAVVKGPNAHPFYKWAAEARPKEVPRWNFHKYLIGRDGYIAEVFPESVEPSDTRVKTAMARALADSLTRRN